MVRRRRRMRFIAKVDLRGGGGGKEELIEKAKW